MAAILGLSAFYHDSAAALVVDGQIAAAAQEERFSRVKHDRSFPQQAIAYCLQESGLAPADLDYVAYYEKPLLKFDRLLETWLAAAPQGLTTFWEAVPDWLDSKLNVRRTIRRRLPGLDSRTPILFTEHHQSHAASAFFPSPFEDAAILTIDGVGEWATATLGAGTRSRLRLFSELRFPHSLGLLYSAFTAYCGFAVNDGEYKLMGLAPYGKPRFRQTIFEHLLDLKPDGSFQLDMRYFDFCRSRNMTGARFNALFGGPPRRGDAPLTERHADIAASIQCAIEEVVIRMARHAVDQAESRNLVLAGGVALNCVANARLVAENVCDRLWIQPAAGDAGGALGAALFVAHQLLDRPRRHIASSLPCPDGQMGTLLGPQFDPSSIAGFLDSQAVPYLHCRSEEELVSRVAAHLAAGRVVGWFQGRMEFGPRALGCRSILADPRQADMQMRLNHKVKRREGFRPFAPAVLAERAAEYFDLAGNDDSPYMLLTAQIAPQHRRDAMSPASEAPSAEWNLLDRLRIVRSTIPAVTHVDGSARLQTVDAGRNPRFHRLLTAFYRQTGCPVLINTSFNVRDEPIVCTPEDAWNCFQSTGIDVLAIGDFIVVKPEGNCGELAGAARDALPASCGRPSGIWRRRAASIDPSPGILRQFGAAGALAAMLMGGILIARGEASGGTAAIAAGLAFGALAAVWPRYLKWPFLAASAVTAPIGWVLTRVILAAVYLLLVTPLGLVRRSRLRTNRSQPRPETFWQPRGEDPADRYLRQY